MSGYIVQPLEASVFSGPCSDQACGRRETEVRQSGGTLTITLMRICVLGMLGTARSAPCACVVSFVSTATVAEQPSCWLPLLELFIAERVERGCQRVGCARFESRFVLDEEPCRSRVEHIETGTVGRSAQRGWGATLALGIWEDSRSWPSSATQNPKP